jgi:L-ribulokinase
MAAATVAGLYPTLLDAQKAMGNGYETEYKPIPENVKKYKDLYEKYGRIGSFIESETK